jgi:hypothetical protein
MTCTKGWANFSSQPSHNKASCRLLASGAVLVLGLLAAPSAVFAVQNAIIGGLTNFDAANYEGETTYGFEIQLDNIQPTEFSSAWPSKYGQPAYVPYATGTYVRYQSTWDPVAQQFIARTVPHSPGAGFQGTCYSFAATDNAGCDHFGPRPTTYNYVVKSYRWLLADLANPGQLIASPNNIFVPTPVYTFVPAPVVGDPEVLVAEVDVPQPAEVEVQYGDATWMKVYVRELDRHVTLEELVDTNTIVPQDPTQIETEWDLVQATPVGAGHRQRGKHVNERAPAAGTRAVIRRYETYAYTGAYDPITHEAVCGGDGSCNIPQDGELGDMLVAQMAAANIAVPSLSIGLVGSGKITSSDGILICGSKCVANYTLNSVVTLTAQPSSNNTFTSWGGACSGSALSCNVTVTDALNVTANFAPIVKSGGVGGGSGGGGSFTLSAGHNNPGTVTATPDGKDRALNCGTACSAKFTSGTAVTVTATPPSGKSFLGWSGACAGTNPSCNLTMSKDLSVTASFSK